jgi:hypothetical protein
LFRSKAAARNGFITLWGVYQRIIIRQSPPLISETQHRKRFAFFCCLGQEKGATVIIWGSLKFVAGGSPPK